MDPDEALPKEHGFCSDASPNAIETGEVIFKDKDPDDPEVRKQVRAKIKEHSVPMRETTIKLPRLLGRMQEMYFNPFTSLFGFAFLWGLAIYCMISPEDAKTKLALWKTQTTKYFTWFFIGANPAFTFFILWLAVRYGHVKLGAKEEKPEFSDVSYFAMIFSAGVAVGLFFFGVSEPLYHQGTHWFAESGYRGQDEIDQWALMLTCYHWGFAGWSPYLIMAISAGLASYHFGLPMTVRSAFYPLLGRYTWGWMGDVIDGFSIVTTVAGICTSLGLGAMQIVAGLQRLEWIDPTKAGDDLKQTYVGVVWVITAIATISVVSGLHVGIKFLSQLGFGVGMLLLFLCLVMEKTYYLFNLMVQTVGYYFQWAIFLVPFWTDAFGQLNEGEGRSVDGNSPDPRWMDWWTVFYMAWWTAWATFVGLFVARVSRGRTIREVVLYCFIAPMIYSIIWFCIFGGTGLRQARQALELENIGEKSFGDPAYFREDGSDFCYNVPQEDVIVNGTTVFTNTLLGITPVCQFDSNTSTQAWFNVMFSFSYPEGGFAGFGPFLAGLSIFAVTVYFVTSSDSGSLIVDHLASNGHEEHHWVQRVFWAFTEGAVATALLAAGGSDALGALQAGSIVFGLPFTLFLFLMCIGIVHMCSFAETAEKSEEGDVDTLPEPEAHGWEMPIYGGIFNIIEYIISLGSVHPERIEKGMDLPTKFQLTEFFKGLLLPFWSLYKIYKLMDPKGERGRHLSIIVLTATYTVLYFAWIGLFACSTINDGFVAFGWSAFFINACILTTLRMAVREHFNISGNIIGDFFAASFFYPQALCQMLLQFEVNPQPSTEKIKE